MAIRTPAPSSLAADGIATQAAQESKLPCPRAGRVRHPGAGSCRRSSRGAGFPPRLVRQRAIRSPGERSRGDPLFLSRRGTRIRPTRLTERLHRYVEASGVGKPGSVHIFRHTMATLMHDAGADIRDLQEILGHAQLSTTEIYTHVSIERLKAVHTRTHPAHLVRGGQPSGEPHDPESSRVGAPAPSFLAAEVLAAEAAEEKAE